MYLQNSDEKIDLAVSKLVQWLIVKCEMATISIRVDLFNQPKPQD